MCALWDMELSLQRPKQGEQKAAEDSQAGQAAVEEAEIEMPIRASEKPRYPKDWKAISHRIRFERAGGECEWPGCKAPHGELIFRLKSNPEQWRTVNSVDLCEGDDDYRGVRVILTVAHLDNQPENCDDSNLMALCQLHHLRLDSKYHVRNSERTRRRKKGNLELFEAIV